MTDFAIVLVLTLLSYMACVTCAWGVQTIRKTLLGVFYLGSSGLLKPSSDTPHIAGNNFGKLSASGNVSVLPRIS